MLVLKNFPASTGCSSSASKSRVMFHFPGFSPHFFCVFVLGRGMDPAQLLAGCLCLCASAFLHSRNQLFLAGVGMLIQERCPGEGNLHFIP